RRRRGPVPRRYRLRHRRLDPRPSCLLRHSRVQADLWSVQPPWRAAALLHPRPHRPDGLDGAGLCHAAAGPGWLRPSRPRAPRPPNPPAPADRPVPDFPPALPQGAKGPRMGGVRKSHETDTRADPAVLRAIEDAIAVFRTQGAEIRDVALPSLDEYRAAG